LNNKDLIQKLYESAVKDMIQTHEQQAWKDLRKQNPDLTDEQIKDKVILQKKERDIERQVLLEKYERLCNDVTKNMVIREILKLHKPEGTYFLSCQGDDFGGWEAESPEWPCRTVDRIFSNME
jgi:hypothetical protein